MASIQFLHRGRIRTLDDPDPTLTLLRWLREEEGLIGTKEGCAEGDCGACTVAFGILDGNAVRYRAVNACLLFLPVLDGKELVTIEDLADPDGALHPVQRALVDQHASQCGFCTPGFAMSLFAQLHDPETGPGEVGLADALAGNLCRCTGYRPILAAGKAVLGDTDRFALRAEATARQLASIRRDATLSIDHNGRTYFAPCSLDAAAELIADHPAARLLAGGTDIGLEVTKAHAQLEALIYLGDVAELAQIDDAHDPLIIGAAATYRDAAPVLTAHTPEAAELLRRLGAVQVRNLGTLGGNIANASPIGDTPPVLMALGATLVLRHRSTERRLALEDFFLDYRQTALAPGEFIAAIEIPRRVPGDLVRVYKLAKRFDQDISAVCAAFRLTLHGDRIATATLAFGGMAAIPKRAAAAEGELVGRTWDEAAALAAAEALTQDFTPLSDVRASADYRLRAAQNLVRKFQLETGPETVPTRVLDYV